MSRKKTYNSFQYIKHRKCVKYVHSNLNAIAVGLMSPHAMHRTPTNLSQLFLEFMLFNQFFPFLGKMLFNQFNIPIRVAKQR